MHEDWERLNQRSVVLFSSCICKRFLTQIKFTSTEKGLEMHDHLVRMSHIDQPNRMCDDHPVRFASAIIRSSFGIEE